jgi:hypothetical protein
MGWGQLDANFFGMQKLAPTAQLRADIDDANNRIKQLTVDGSLRASAVSWTTCGGKTGG